jgi:hypothetical protein
MSYELKGFNTVEVYDSEGGYICLKQVNWSEHSNETPNIISFPPDELDNLIALLKAVKKDMEQPDLDE